MKGEMKGRSHEEVKGRVASERITGGSRKGRNL